jgi:hypothetical protein
MDISDRDRISALTSLYTTERADLSNIANQSLAIVGLALTYIIAVFIGLPHAASIKKSSLLWFASPIPVLVFLAFYTLWVSLAIARTRSCKELEKKIASEVGVNVGSIGVTVSDKIMDIEAARPVYRIIILTAYAPIIVAGISLIVYVLFEAIHHHANVWIVIVSIVLYVALLAPSTTVWFKQFHL